MKREQQKKSESSSTSWEPVEKWYHAAVGETGHYYHKQVIIPNLLALIGLTSGQGPSSDALLDLGCGQGILARHLPETLPYTGIDISPALIKAAKQADKNSRHHYIVGDVTKPLPLKEQKFSLATLVLALQNIEYPDRTFKHLAAHMVKGGRLFLVLNHPCFRIPRQSSWQVDKDKKIQYRRIDHYMSGMKIPIQAHPSKGGHSAQTLTFHHPLSAYTRWLQEAGFAIAVIEEWCSDKVSTGAAAKMENRSRNEFPLFLTFSCVYK
jgi:ubiquinone/menaquinone biosynthesis C-methylase UbiE